VLALVLSWAKGRGKITVNPCERAGRVYNGTRVDFVWSEDDEAAFLKGAPVHLHLPLLLTFNDLRGTAVTRLALVECTEAQIASITGHSLRDVRSILDAHYLHRDPKLARDAIHKLELGYAMKAGAVVEAKTGT
jgi:hypothetical protein